MTLLLFAALWINAPEISLDHSGLYRDTHLTLFKTQNGYLLNSTGEGVAVLFGEDGSILGKYDRQGPGPREFNRQYVLSVDERGIHFCSNGRFILSFDHALKPIAATMPNLPAQPHLNANHGISWRQDSILVSLSGRQALFAEIRNVNGSWKFEREYFPTGTGNLADSRQFLRHGKRPLLHGTTLFSSKMTVTASEDHYAIDVYSDFKQQPDQNATSLILGAGLEEIPVSGGMRALVYSAIQAPEGYVVELFTHMRPGGAGHRWHDYFNREGGFLKRVMMDDTRLLPVVNGEGAFLLDDRGDDRVLKRIY